MHHYRETKKQRCVHPFCSIIHLMIGCTDSNPGKKLPSSKRRLFASACLLLAVSSLVAVLNGCVTIPDSPPAARLVTPDYPFKSDGCSCVPDLDIETCCLDHDRAYWCGGARWQKLQADHDFRQCIRDADRQKIAALYFMGVRVGGSPYLPTPWRWGFGWSYPKGYFATPVICE